MKEPSNKTAINLMLSQEVFIPFLRVFKMLLSNVGGNVQCM